MSSPTNLQLSSELSPIPSELKHVSHDPRALRILAKTIYRELRQNGLAEEDVMSLAGELLSLVTCDVKDRRRLQSECSDAPPISPKTSASAPLPKVGG
jgi:hypothetical protein